MHEKMNYVFDIDNFDILNRLIFDSSVEYEDVIASLDKNPLVLELERRTFENVTRKKGLIGTTTHYLGRRSELCIYGLKRATVKSADERFKNNHFINEITVNQDSNVARLTTSFGLELMLEFDKYLTIKLIDKGESEVGKGSSRGKHGFTEDEWEEYLKEKKYAPQHYLIRNAGFRHN